ncbi:aldo/keto reductase [bacterium]|nr:aldo/keto reductase [bacterium]
MSRIVITRRRFIQGAAALAGAALIPPGMTQALAGLVKKTASDLVELGRTGLRLSRLGFGAGTDSGSVQRSLGHEGFNSLVRYAYDQGITYIDTADGYRTHTWIREAIKGLPREKFFILTKMGGIPEDPAAEIDRFRSELGTDYIDCLLVHCKVEADWDQSHRKLMDAFSEAKQKGIILSHGVSCHSLPALETAARLDWVDVNLVRINPQGMRVDAPGEDWTDDSVPEHVPAVLKQLKVMRKNGHGIIGMKLIGNGKFTRPDDREKSIRFALQPGRVDAAVIGFKSNQEIDEAVSRINAALADG